MTTPENQSFPVSVASSVTGDVGGNVVGSVGSVANLQPNGGSALPAATSIYDALTMQHQPDAAVIVANPVSDATNAVMPTTKNVRILGMAVSITWAITQPTNLRIIILVDGQTLTFTIANPVSGSSYIAWLSPYNNPANQTLDLAVGAQSDNARSFLLEGRSVKIDAAVTWAITQPTNLTCRVIHATR